MAADVIGPQWNMEDIIELIDVRAEVAKRSAIY